MDFVHLKRIDVLEKKFDEFTAGTNASISKAVTKGKRVKGGLTISGSGDAVGFLTKGTKEKIKESICKNPAAYLTNKTDKKRVTIKITSKLWT